MYEIRIDKNKKILFTNKVDAENYVNYMYYGLKVVKKQDGTYYFNNGDRLINTSYLDRKSYVLRTRTGKRITSEKLQKKYIAAITENKKEH